MDIKPNVPEQCSVNIIDEHSCINPRCTLSQTRQQSFSLCPSILSSCVYPGCRPTPAHNYQYDNWSFFQDLADHYCHHHFHQNYHHHYCHYCHHHFHQNYHHHLIIITYRTEELVDILRMNKGHHLHELDDC